MHEHYDLMTVLPEIKPNNPNNTNLEIRRQKMSIQNIAAHRCGAARLVLRQSKNIYAT